MHRLRAQGVLLLVAAAALQLSAVTVGTGNVTWANMRVGGGGYVTGTFFSQATPDVMYFKTDVGGAYRRTTSSASPDGIAWQPLLDSLTADQSEYYSVSHLALDAGNGLNIYALLGSLPNYDPCELWHSTDGGDTWTVMVNHSQWKVQCGGNYADRGVGDRLAIHPADNNTLLVASYDGHLFVTRDGFASGPAGVHNLSLPGLSYPTKNVTRSVHFVPLTTAANAAYAGVVTVPGMGVWMSLGPSYEDPSTWTLQAATPGLGSISRLLVEPSGPYVYYTTEGGFGRMSFTTGATPVLQIDWQYAPAPPYNLTYDGLAVHPGNTQDLTFLSIGTDSDTTFMRTLDGGKTFFAVNWTTLSSVPWAYNNSYGLKLNAASSFNYNPFGAPSGRTASTGSSHASSYGASTPEAWVSDFFGVWRSTDWDGPVAVWQAGGDPTTVQVTFINSEWGHEEVCYNFVKAPPVGAVLSGVADDFGWRHDRGLDNYPTSVYPTKDDHNCGFGSDYTLSLSADGQSQQAIWVTAGDEYGSCRYNWCGTHHFVGVSYDGGVSFVETAYDAAIQDSNGYPYRVAVHPFNGSVAVITGYQGMPLVYSHDAGQSWSNATNTASNSPLMSVGPWGNFWWAQPLTRDNNANPSNDPSVPATFYYYNTTTTLYSSTDNGMTWSPVYNGFPEWSVPLAGIAVPPRGTAAAGDIWAFAGWQLHHSTNGGANFSSVWQFYSVKAVIAVGPLPNATSPKTGLTSAEMSARCAAKVPEELRPKPAPREMIQQDLEGGLKTTYPVSTAASAAYVVYVVGQGSGDSNRQAVYASVDYGQHWVDLTTAQQGLGDSPAVLEASLQSPGLLFVGTDGRGGFYADVSAVLMDALEECSQ